MNTKRKVRLTLTLYGPHIDIVYGIGEGSPQAAIREIIERFDEL